MQAPLDKQPALLEELDRCVKCGLCLAECPTYRLSRNENESPRGRLALMEALFRGDLDADGKLAEHLHNCIGCRRCERVCPSGVRYATLLDAALALVPSRGRQTMARVFGKARVLGWASALARQIPLPLSSPVARLHRLHATALALHRPGDALQPAGPRHATTRGRVGLFAGCAVTALQPGAVTAATRLLNHIGYAVAEPSLTGCCGALAAHAGDRPAALRLAEQNRVALDDAQLDAVISLVSGCGIHLDAYAPPLPTVHMDILRFLVERGLAKGLLRNSGFRALRATVALHRPCSVENVYHGGAWAPSLLGLIDGLRWRALGEPGQCCGAAGDHMLRHPRQAEAIRQPLLEQLLGDPPEMLLTSNLGCALHLAAGLREQGVGLEVLHPVELLARQLEIPD